METDAAEQAVPMLSPAEPGSEVDRAFRPVRRLWNSTMESHREACAVLAAVTESIKASGGEETPTAYWAALMSTLEHTRAAEEKAAVAALTHLLSLIYPV